MGNGPLLADRLNGSPRRPGISDQSVDFDLDAGAGSGRAAWASIWVLCFALHQSKSRTSPCWSRYMECIAIPLFIGARTSLLASRAWSLRDAIAKMMAIGPAFVVGRTMTNTGWLALWIDSTDCRSPVGAMENV